MHPLLAQQLATHFASAPPAAEVADFVRAVDAAYGNFQREAEAARAAASLDPEVRAVIEAIPDVILRLDAGGNVTPLKAPEHAADPQAHRFTKRRISSRLADLPNPTVRAAFQRGLAAVLADGRPASFEYAIPGEDGEKFFEVRLVALRAAGAIAIIQDITARKHAQADHERLNERLVATSRQAGMAEVATGVLHNVGNVLNSVNVSAGLVVDQLRRSRVASLARGVQLMQAHRADLAAFLTADAKGRKWPDFLVAVAGELEREQAVLLAEAQGLQRNVEHIKQIVAMQQSCAKSAGALESLALPALVEDALRMASATLALRAVEIVREFAEVPPVVADRHAVLQILVNLIRNAVHALEARATDRRLTLRLEPDGADRVHLRVSDNGVGIAPENLARIFNHGFTTKKDGHGFGLHSGANAAKEMGGSLTVQSDGPGAGATFTLELPLRSPAIQPQEAAA
jgi:two-component system sensor kinase FixL